MIIFVPCCYDDIMTPYAMSRFDDAALLMPAAPPLMFHFSRLLLDAMPPLRHFDDAAMLDDAVVAFAPPDA